jgi:hypothetical protein
MDLSGEFSALTVLSLGKVPQIFTGDETRCAPQLEKEKPPMLMPKKQPIHS